MTSEASLDTSAFSDQQKQSIQEFGEQIAAFTSGESASYPGMEMGALFGGAAEQSQAKPEFPAHLQRLVHKLVEYCIDKAKTQRQGACDALGVKCDWPDSLKPFVFEPEPIAADKLTPENIERWANGDEVFMRIELARRGLAAEILKYDPVALVRFHILKKTGQYNERFQQEETSPLVIAEMIRQNIARDFWLEFNDETAQMVNEQRAFEDLMTRIEQGDRERYLMAMNLLTEFSEQVDSTSSLPLHDVALILSVLFENADQA